MVWWVLYSSCSTSCVCVCVVSLNKNIVENIIMAEYHRTQSWWFCIKFCYIHLYVCVLCYVYVRSMTTNSILFCLSPCHGWDTIINDSIWSLINFGFALRIYIVWNSDFCWSFWRSYYDGLRQNFNISWKNNIPAITLFLSPMHIPSYVEFAPCLWYTNTKFSYCVGRNFAGKIGRIFFPWDISCYHAYIHIMHFSFVSFPLRVGRLLDTSYTNDLSSLDPENVYEETIVHK